MQIQSTLNRKQADALFDAHAVCMNGEDVIFEYVAADIFGRDVMAWIEAGMKYQGYIVGGKHYNGWGSGCQYFYKAGFDMMVTQHNYLISKVERSQTEGGRIWDELWAVRIAKIRAEDAEEERKREERKTKRAAARKAKQEAAEQAAST